MRRLAFALLLVVALPAMAAEKWVESYNRGVDAVRANNFKQGADLLQRALSETPSENAAARVRDQIFTYVPHFWLGIAKLNLGDPDAAIREWKTSEEQGAIQNTPYFAQLREWIGRANAEKLRRAEASAVESKKVANAAVGRAVSAQMDAVGAGADRSDGYRAAQRKLQEAIDTNAKAGINVSAYQRAADLANEARDLFAAAGEEAKRVKASRPAPVKQPPPQVAVRKVPDAVVTFDDTPAPQPKQAVAQPQPVVNTATVAPPPAVPPAKPPATIQNAAAQKAAPAQPQPEVVTEAAANARIAAQEARRRQLETKAPPVPKPQPAIATAAPAPVQIADASRARLESAYRAYAAGDLVASERLLSQLLASKESAEAYLLRGCARYTRAMLVRAGEPLLASAAGDFRNALRINRSVRLDRSAWSPKLVAYFEQIRGR